jgi:hypothetical protein
MELAFVLLESVEFSQNFLSRVGIKGDLGHEGRDVVEMGEIGVGEQEAVVSEVVW